MSESSEMNLKFMLLSLVICLGVGLSVAQDPSNSTSCPYPGCNCDGGNLVCRGLNAFPTLPTPNPFTVFAFYAGNIETLSRLSSAYGNATVFLAINCGLSSVTDDAFELLKGLETLELGGNRLQRMTQASLSPLKNLLKLDLSFNRFKDLPDELFKDLPKLREIDLGGNQLQFTENLFSGTGDALTKLSCNDCHLRSVPTSSLRKISMLEHLELNENPFQSIQDDTFQGLQHIRNLSLNNCSLSAISTQALQPFNSLRQLNFGHNVLKSLPAGAFNYSWKSLKELDLESNLFTSLEEHLAPWYSLEELKLSNNSWHCDCNFAWIKNISVDVFHKDNVTCVSPAELLGHSIVKVNASQMTCPEDNSMRRLRVLIGFGIPAMVLGVTLTICGIIKVTSRRRRYKGTDVKYSQVYGETTSTFDSTHSLVST